MSGTGRHRLLSAIVVLIVAIQVLVPARAFLDERPGRFGWQMYSSFNPPPKASVEDADGQLTSVPLADLIADPRAEIHWANPLADRLCDGAGVVAVVVEDRDGTTRVPCR